jgi:peptidoglycan hydrolase-like protein with peptidoglycan-binding domain
MKAAPKQIRMMKITVTCVAAFLLAGTSASYSQSGYIPGQPSFDCTKARSTVAIILCNEPEAAAADWDVNSASWALYFSVNESGRQTVDADQQAWRQSLDAICALPRQQTPEDQADLAMTQFAGRMMLGPRFNIPGPQPITRAHVSCLIKAYRARAAMLRSNLTGDALAESRLRPEQRVKLQEALVEKGFFRPDEIGSGTHDGQFGPITRKAIKQFQKTLGAFPSGFLTSDQRFALLERPEEREARIARAAAEAKAKRDALAAQEAAAAKAERDAQIEAERGAAEAAAKEQAKRDVEQKRLEAEAEAAREWGRRLDEARTKGPQYAAQVGLKWSLSEKQNPMTDDNDYTVTSIQPNGMGAQALIEGTCQRGGPAVFLATLTETGDQTVPLGLPTFQNGVITGEKRVNDERVFPTAFHNDMFKNRIVVTTLSSVDPAESIDTTWRVLAQVQTSRGPVVIKIPLFDSNIQKLLIACKKQQEITNRRGVSSDGLNSQR